MLWKEIHDELLNDVRAGHYAAGEKMPTEAELARRFCGCWLEAELLPGVASLRAERYGASSALRRVGCCSAG